MTRIGLKAQLAMQPW